MLFHSNASFIFLFFPGKKRKEEEEEETIK